MLIELKLLSTPSTNDASGMASAGQEQRTSETSRLRLCVCVCVPVLCHIIDTRFYTNVWLKASQLLNYVDEEFTNTYFFLPIPIFLKVTWRIQRPKISHILQEAISELKKPKNPIDEQRAGE